MVTLANPYAGQTAALDPFFPSSSLVWAAIGKVADKELKTNTIDEGSSHVVAMHLSGTVDRQLFSQQIEARLLIGHPQTRASSVNPQVGELIAWILGKLNAATRNRILADLPSEFVTNGGMPMTDPELIDESNRLLRKLRQTKTIIARGAIRCEYTL